MGTIFLVIIIINFFVRVFSECTEAVATSLIPLVTNFAEICAFIIVTGSGKRDIFAHIFKIELLTPQGRVSSQL